MAEILFKWVHLSDIHYRIKNSEFDTKQMLEKLKGYLAKFFQVNAMIVTGDFRFAPSAENNPQGVVNLLKDYAKALQINIDDIFVLPGNHDLTRSFTRSCLIDGVRNDYDTGDGTFPNEALKGLNEGFEFFFKLEEALGKERADFSVNPHRCIVLENCNLLFINTAITAGRSDKNGKNADDECNLLMGTSYLEAAIRDADKTKPTLAFGHHGFDFFNKQDEKKFSKYLEKDAAVKYYGCGHSHDLWVNGFGEKGRQIISGCTIREKDACKPGFSVGELLSDGTVNVCFHTWDTSEQEWCAYSVKDKMFGGLYAEEVKRLLAKSSSHASTNKKELSNILKDNIVPNSLSLHGYRLLGKRGADGIKYIWKKNEKYIESIAFNRRMRDSVIPSDESISAYTTSVSCGCALGEKACKFCATGRRHGYLTLTADEIALQNIFMAEFDSDCPSWPNVRNNQREFAYMGQGEPGLCYPSVRQSILLTDFAMNKINQQVSRYIISTCGINDFLPMLIDDVKNSVYSNKVTLHFSLHALGEERKQLMPITSDYDYNEFIKLCRRFYDVSGEKIGVGILMFSGFRAEDEESAVYTLDEQYLNKILNILDKEVFKVDLCDVNKTDGYFQSVPFSNEMAMHLRDVSISCGFETKIFSSFGDTEDIQAGCGMLFSNISGIELAGEDSIVHYENALKLLKDAKSALV